MEIIELKHIAKEYRSDSVVTPALSDIDLSIKKGELPARTLPAQQYREAPRLQP